jgi:hypothetical protein
MVYVVENEEEGGGKSKEGEIVPTAAQPPYGGGYNERFSQERKSKSRMILSSG